MLRAGQLPQQHLLLAFRRVRGGAPLGALPAQQPLSDIPNVGGIDQMDNEVVLQQSYTGSRILS